MAVLYLSTPERGAAFARAFAEQLPEVPFWQGRAEDPAAVRYLVTWTAPERLAETYPNLRLIFSVGAGVDQLGPREPAVQGRGGADAGAGASPSRCANM